MQSKTSCFNKTLFRTNVKRFWPVWVLTTLAGLMIPVLTIAEKRSGAVYSIGKARALYADYVADMLPALSLIYAIIVAMTVWNYLFQTRSINQMHSMPISRKTLFITNFISGLAIYFIPFVVAGLLEIILTTVLAGFAGKEILIAIGASLVEGFFFFSFATVVAFITGNILALPVLYVIFNFLSVGFEYVINVFISGFIPGYPNFENVRLTYLSPIWGLYSKIRGDYSYTYVNTEYYSYGMGEQVYSEINVTNLEILLGYLLAAVLLAALAFFLYSKSESENAGNVIACKTLRKPILAIYTVGCGITGAEILYAVFSSFDYKKYNIVSMSILLIVSATIAYYVGLMLLEKTTRVFTKKNFKGIAIVSACLVAFAVSLNADIYGIFDKIPKMEDIHAVNVSVQYRTEFLVTGEDDELIEEVLDLHKAIISEKDYWAGRKQQTYNGDTDYNLVEITYYLNNGKSISRYYSSLPVTRERVNDESTYDYKLCRLATNPKLVVKQYEKSEDYPYLGYVGINPVNSKNDYLQLTGEDAEKFVTALITDISDNYVDKDILFDTYVKRYSYNGVFTEICYSQNPSDPKYDYRCSYASAYITPKMENTCNLCIEKGWLTEKDILDAMTYSDELNAVDYVD